VLLMPDVLVAPIVGAGGASCAERQPSPQNDSE
jgi:hypothetical protein